MDLALNNLQKLICHKAQTTKQHNMPNNRFLVSMILFVYLFWFYGILTPVGYLMPNPFLYK